MKLYTMGFAKKTASEFFGTLERNGVRTMIDVRLNNTSQLAGFTKGADLPFFLRRVSGIGYEHWLICAPTKELMTAAQSGSIDHQTYVEEYNKLLEERNVIENVDLAKLDSACLLCSEPMPDSCHRKLLAEYFVRHIGGVEIEHL